jgi:23S rRNA (guanosine2251-2'-O)-methyltransferase
MKKFKKSEGRGPQVGGRSRAPSRPTPRPSAGPVTPQGRCVVGIHAVEELLSVRPRSIENLWLREGYLSHPALKKIFEDAERLRVRVQMQSPGAMDRVVSSHQGVLAFSNAQPELAWPALEKLTEATIVALDEVEDPHNLGAVLRTAWLLGAQAVLTPEHRSAQLSPAVSKVAQGAVEHVPVISDGPLPSQLEDLKRRGFWVLGLAAGAKQELYSFNIPQKVVWVLGSEAGGIRKSVEGICDDLVSIPQLNAGASYNVSVAAALAMGETFRQRKIKSV